MLPTSDATGTASTADPPGSSLLWIDGVGGYLLRFGPQLVVGGAGGRPGEADLALMANLSRRHAVLRLAGERYLLEPLGRTAVDGRPVDEPTPLADGSEIELRSGVKLRFRQPSLLSTTCRLDFVSGHRPKWSIDGVLLVQDTLLLGPGDQNHVVCRDWPESVILSRRNGVLHCRSQSPLMTGEFPMAGETPVTPGAVVTGNGLRFRIEEVEESDQP